MADIIKQLDRTEYDLTLVETDVPCTIKIGGDDIATDGKFVPNINASKWDDEFWFNINFPAAVSIEKETFVDGVIELNVDGLIHRFYPKEIVRDYVDIQTSVEGLEYEIEYNKRPPDEIHLNITHAEGVYFVHQPTLEEDYNLNPLNYKTIEEYLENHTRPENIINSYAVRCNKRNNQYKIGKICHIERSSITDATRRKAWCEQSITPTSPTNALWTIRPPKEFLENAIYPVKIGPIIGNDDSPTSDQTMSTDYIWSSRFACVANGSTAQADWYACIYCTTASAVIEMAVYSDVSGTISGGTHLSSNETSYTCSLNDYGHFGGTLTPPAFSNGTDYWLALARDTNGVVKIRYDTETYNDMEQEPYDFDTIWPETFPEPEAPVARNYGLYIDYTEAGAPSGIVVLRRRREDC